MTSFHPTKVQQFAIEAKLNRFFGAKVYDRVFLGFEVLEVVEDELRACRHQNIMLRGAPNGTQ